MSEAKIGREELRSALVEAVSAFDFALAAWFGGSDATGRTDELSDIDLQIIVPDEEVERSFIELRRALERLSPIAAAVRMPRAPHTPYEQEFFQLRHASQLHVIDFAVFPLSSPPEQRFLEPQRHGRPVKIFDRGSYLVAPPLDGGAHLQRMRKRLQYQRDSYEIFQVLGERALARGHLAEAANTYQRFTLTPLVELLRMRHDPARFDYGFRYLDRDLPAADRQLIERLMFPSDAAELTRFQREARERFRTELAALDAGEWQLEPPADA